MVNNKTLRKGAAASWISSSSYSSLAFQDCPQTSSLVVLMNLVVYSRSSLEPLSFFASMVPLGPVLSEFPCIGGEEGQNCRTCCGVWGPVSQKQ